MARGVPLNTPKIFVLSPKWVMGVPEHISKHPKDYDMPTPFMCHGCDKPTMNKSGICNDCIKKQKKKEE